MELIIIASINDIFKNHNSLTKKTFASEILEGVNSSFRMTDATVIQNCIELNQINSPATQRALQIHSFKGHSFTMENLFRTEVFKQFQEISRLTEFINPTFLHNLEIPRSFAPLFTTADNFDEENLEELVKSYQDSPDSDSILEDANDFDEEELYESIEPFFNGFDLKGKFLKYLPKGKWREFLVWLAMAIHHVLSSTSLNVEVNTLSQTAGSHSSQVMNQTNIQTQNNIQNQTINNNYTTINNQTIINQESSHQIVAVKPSIISSNWKRTKTRSKKK